MNIQAIKNTSVKAIYISSVRGLRRLRPNQVLLRINHVYSKEVAVKYVKNAVTLFYKNKDGEDKKVTGFIRAAHGNKGVVRASFERNLNPQWIGSDVFVQVYKVVE